MLHYVTSVVFNRDLCILALRRGNPSFRLLDIPYMPWYTCGMAATPSTMFPLGTAAPPFALPDVESLETISLQTFAGKKALLVIFLCRHCKYVQHVKQALTTLGWGYQGTDLAIVAISANDAAAYAQDAPASLKAMAAAESFTFPLCYDESQVVAKAYTAACTPDFFLFDGQRTLVYRGQLDANRPGNQIPVTGTDLRATIEAVLAHQPINPVQKPGLGCNITWKKGHEPSYFLRQ
jgi:peroxiredoxin